MLPNLVRKLPNLVQKLPYNLQIYFKNDFFKIVETFGLPLSPKHVKISHSGHAVPMWCDVRVCEIPIKHMWTGRHRWEKETQSAALVAGLKQHERRNRVVRRDWECFERGRIGVCQVFFFHSTTAAVVTTTTTAAAAVWPDIYIIFQN